MKDFVTYEEVSEAYFECRRHKRNKLSALAYELEYEANNYRLYKRLNQGKFNLGNSIAFCVTRPKLREVFAASFEARIIHHLLVRKFIDIFEGYFIKDSYSCRKEKGVLYGVKRIAEQSKEIGKDGWFLKIDLKGFFMSIDKDVLYDKIRKLIESNYNGDNVQWWLALWRAVIYDRPERHCIIRGNKHLWDDLPWHKSLFKSNGRGLPIGNLTSQMLANLMLTDIDRKYSGITQGYGRYVDDIVMLDTDKNKLLRCLYDIQQDLERIGLRINPNKTILQRTDKGIPFIGYIVKPWGLYAGKRLVRNAIQCSKDKAWKDKYIKRTNSYLGFLIHTLSYNIRKSIYANTLRLYPLMYAKHSIKSIHPIIKLDMKLTESMPQSQFSWRKNAKYYTVFRWNPVLQEDGVTIVCEQDTLAGTVTLPRVRALIEGDINKDTDERILNGFSWTPANENEAYNVYLSTENQFNFKAAYDLAVQTNGASLPVTFKFSKSGTAVYHTFTTLEEFTDFYTKSVAHINQCLNDGWQKKDAVDYSKYGFETVQ